VGDCHFIEFGRKQVPYESVVHVCVLQKHAWGFDSYRSAYSEMDTQYININC